MNTTPKVHVHISVSDLARSRAFYTAFFGAEPVKTKPGYVKFLPDFGPLNLALSQGSPGAAPERVNHMGLQVRSSGIVREQLDRVKRAGLPVREEMAVDCCYANSDKFWVTDPDGVEWEVYHLNRDIDSPGYRVGATEDGASEQPSGTCCVPAGVERSESAQTGGECCTPAGAVRPEATLAGAVEASSCCGPVGSPNVCSDMTQPCCTPQVSTASKSAAEAACRAPAGTVTKSEDAAACCGPAEPARKSEPSLECGISS